MQLIEEISFILGLAVSLLFYLEYKRVEKLDEREEMLDRLLN